MEVRDIRAELLAQGIVPKLILRGVRQLRSMTWNETNISVLCEDWQRVQVWFDKLDIPYCGQGLAGGSFEALQCLLKRSNVRVPLTGEEKAVILELCGH